MLLLGLILVTMQLDTPFFQTSENVSNEFRDFKVFVVIDPFCDKRTFEKGKELAVQLKEKNILVSIIVFQGEQNVKIYLDPSKAKFLQRSSRRIAVGSGEEQDAGLNFAASQSSDEYSVARFFLTNLHKIIQGARNESRTTLWVTNGFPESRNNLSFADSEAIASGQIGTISSQNVPLATRVCDEFTDSFSLYNMIHMLDLSKGQKGKVLAALLRNPKAYLVEGDLPGFPFYRWYKR